MSLLLTTREADSLIVRLQQTLGRAAGVGNVVDNVCMTANNSQVPILRIPRKRVIIAIA